MCLLKKLLNKATDSDRSLTTKLATVAGCKVPALHKFIHEPTREFDNYEGLLKVIRYLFPDREQEIMADYALSLNVNKRTARNMLEYLVTNRLKESFGQLLHNMKNADNKTTKEWALFYDFFYEWQDNEKKTNYLSELQRIRSTKAITDEMKVLQSLLEIYAYHQIKEYKILKELMNRISILVENLEDGYVKSSYIIRIREMQSIISFRVHNDVETARAIAEETINTHFTDRSMAFALYVKGMSYFFINYKTSLKYLEKSKLVYEEINYDVSVSDVMESMETLKAYWGIDTNYTTLRNKYLYKALQNQTIIIEEEFKEDIPFFKLVEGIQNKDVNLLIESIIHFVKKGNSFYANIAKREVNKLGTNDSFIDTLISMYND